MALLTGCTTDVDLINYIDIDAPLTLSRQENKLQTEKLDNHSEKYLQFIEWAKNNTSDWTSTPATYISTTVVSQGDFRLVYNKDYVVVSFIDKDQKARQLSKAVKLGELDFLLK